ncbi:MAG TPA: alcohol dehydrogenase catalytic domain-containing protein [Candidatus Acidoferrales bacterium]|nr:alcohol dehydrogenase catalytic domain-containing protein [Candidatus Acidoferrales bacterium]
MRALAFDGQKATVVERDVPQVAGDLALVRVTLAGICNTDLELTKGYMGFHGTLGHEFVGVVEGGPPHWMGQRVVGEINFGCGRCVECTRGMSRHCAKRRVMGILDADGAFADYVVVPIENLHSVPDTVVDAAAVFTEPLAAAFEILEQLSIEPRMRAVVLGDGKLGLLVAQVLYQAGANVTAVGKHIDKLAILDDLGIQTCLLTDWSPTPVDLVVEASGTAAGFAAAVATLRARGTLVLKSTHAEAAPMNLAPLVINEITVVGSRCGRFEPAIEALSAHRIDVRRLISAERPLQRGVEGLQLAAAPGMLKVLLRPEG